MSDARKIIDIFLNFVSSFDFQQGYEIFFSTEIFHVFPIH